jgi:predicted TIM-barrel fold metal-dependent hydrolase
VVLLAAQPHHRHAARLAARHPHVYADLGASLGPTVPRAAAALAELLELAPFGKLLYSSGGRRLPEQHAVAALVFREALHRVVGGLVSEGAWSWRDADRVAAMLAADNARRLYRLDERG